MPKRPLVVDVSEENKQLGIQPLNVGGLLVTTGPELAPIAPLGGTYWVDNTYTGGSNDGSDERPFTTITAGLARIAAQVGFASGTLLLAGNPDYTAEGVIAIPDSITARIFAWGSPSQQPVSFSATCGTGAPLLFLRGCNVTLTLGDSIVQADMSSIVGVSNTGGSTLVMRGGSARLSGQVCRLSGEADDVACTSMHIGAGEAALDFGILRCDSCNVEAATLVAGELEFRTTSFASATGITCGTIRMDRQSERAAALAGVSPSSLPTSLEPGNPIYGTGGLGNVTVAAGTTSLADNAEGFSNLTINGTGTVEVNRHILRVQNLLDLSAAPASAITVRANRSGGDAAAGVGGTGGVGENGWIAGTTGLQGGTAGAAATNGAGTTPIANTGARYAYGGASGAVGAAGNGVNAGAPAAAANTTSNARVLVETPAIPFIGPPGGLASAFGDSLAVGSQPGRAGGAGGGDNSGGAGPPGGGGGGAAAGAGCLVIFARGIKIGAATPANCVFCRGYNGGDGGVGTASALATGGGAGGAGSGGGLILVVYDWIIGNGASASMLSAPGGDGGPGGNGNGSGAAQGGSGGGSGDGGQIIKQNLLTAARSRTTGTAGAGPTAPAGNVGGGITVGGTCTATLP
jgi:hypothetical protein